MIEYFSKFFIRLEWTKVKGLVKIWFKRRIEMNDNITGKMFWQSKKAIGFMVAMISLVLTQILNLSPEETSQLTEAIKTISALFLGGQTIVDGITYGTSLLKQPPVINAPKTDDK